MGHEIHCIKVYFEVASANREDIGSSVAHLLKLIDGPENKQHTFSWKRYRIREKKSL